MISNWIPLDVATIERDTRHLSLRPSIQYVPTIDSTNRLARELPPDEWTNGTTIVTDYQAAGRGRTGRAWVAPPGTSLLLSVLVELPPASSSADGIMMMTLAVADAVEWVTALRPTLKWPNDVLMGDKKISGILGEYVPEEGRRRLILGAGINVNFDPESEGLHDATSVGSQVGHTVSRERLAIALFDRLDVWYCALTKNPDALFRTWAGCLDTIGCEVVVTDAESQWEGTAVGVQRDGGLHVRELGGETRTVYAADVSVKKV